MQFKGTVYISTRAFLEKRFGPQAGEQVLAKMPAGDRELLREVSPVAWYPVAPILAFHRTLDREFGTGDQALCFEAGRFSADWSLNTILKMFVRFRSPHWLVEKATSVWSRYHDSGHWSFDPPQERRLSGRLVDFAVRDEVFCTRLRGWLTGAVELTGGTNPKVIERGCVVRGHSHHEYTCTW